MIKRAMGCLAVCLAFIVAFGSEGHGEDMKKTGETMIGGKKVPPVDFRALKALLPESLPGIRRTDATGERTSGFGISVSSAKGSYEADGGGKIDIEITDMGSMRGIVAMAEYGRMTVDIDRETDTGYERTSTYAGHRAYEQYDKAGERGEIQVLVGGRFVVEVNGSGVEMDAIKGALGKIDLSQLDAMKMHGVEQ